MTSENASPADIPKIVVAPMNTNVFLNVLKKYRSYLKRSI